MSITSMAIHALTGVPRPRTDAAELSSLSDKFDTVMQAAATVGAGTRSVVSDIEGSNQGAALDAYTAAMATSIDQLDYLGEKAEATRVAHRSAAAIVAAAKTNMQAICVAAARALAAVLSSPDPAPHKQRLWSAVVNAARVRLRHVEAVADGEIRSAYSGILPINLIRGLGEGHKRGTVPPKVADEFANLTPEERIQFYRNLADKVTEDWPDEDKPEVIFYSTQDPLPPGTQPVPDGYDPNKWKGYNGVRLGDAIYLNYETGIQNNPITGTPPEPFLMSTTVHEIQHVDQGRMRDEYHALSQDDINAIKAGQKEDPFVDRGSTIHEVERFDIPYEPTGTPGYTHQPVEIDARRAGTEYLDNMSEEEMLELMP